MLPLFLGSLVILYHTNTWSSLGPWRCATKVGTLHPLPSLGARHPHTNRDEDDCPLPRDAGMQKHDMIQPGDINGWENNGKHDRYRKE